MKTYRGYYICPHCEEKFEWEYIDDGYRRNRVGYMAPIRNIEPQYGVASCAIKLALDDDNKLSQHKVLRCYCTHCQMPIDIEDTGDIPQELFA